MDTGTIGIIIGSVALILTIAVPTIYTVLGKAKVSVEFNAVFITTGKILQIEVYNRPYKNSIFRCLNIKRGAVDDLVVLFDIKRRDSKEFVTHNYKHAESEFRPSIVPMTIPIIEVNNGQVTVRQVNQSIILKPDIYTLYVHLGVDGKRVSNEKNFIVTTNSPFADWETN